MKLQEFRFLKSKRTTLLSSLILFLCVHSAPVYAHQFSHSYMVLKRLGVSNLDTALDTAEANLMKNPEDLKSLWIRAEMLQFNEKYLLARSAFAQLHEIAVKKKVSKKDLAAVYAEQGLLQAYIRRASDATQSISEALEFDPHMRDANLLLAVRAWLTTNRDAIAYFNKHASAVRDVDAYIAKAHYLFVEGKSEEAMLTLKEAEKVDPQTPFANYERAYIYMTRKDARNAEKFADLAQRKFSFGGYIYADIANLYKKEGRIDLQLAAMRKLAIHWPTKEAYSTLCNVLIERGKYDEAVQVFDRAHKHFPQVVDFLDRKCKLLRRAKRWKEALATAQYRLERFERDKSHAYVARGLCYEGLGDYKNAIADFDRGLQARPGAREVLNRARCNLQLKNYQRCIDDANSWLKEHPAHIVASELKARALFGMSKTEEALQEAQMLVEASGENPVFFTLRAEILQKSGRAREAAADFARAKQIHAVEHSPDGND